MTTNIAPLKDQYLPRLSSRSFINTRLIGSLTNVSLCLHTKSPENWNHDQDQGIRLPHVFSGRILCLHLSVIRNFRKGTSLTAVFKP